MPGNTGKQQKGGKQQQQGGKQASPQRQGQQGRTRQT